VLKGFQFETKISPLDLAQKLLNMGAKNVKRMPRRVIFKGLLDNG